MQVFFRLSSNQKWLGIFGIWLLILSGVFAGFLSSPGALQAFRLRNLLKMKQEQLARVQTELAKLQLEATQLETNPAAQLREIRRVLGYAASDELIFDFSTHDP